MTRDDDTATDGDGATEKRPRIANAEDVSWSETGGGFGRKRLAAAAGGHDLGCSLYELSPGERAWPYHYHLGNEEALYVLAGRGRLRLADEEHAIEDGDYVALPTGEDGAHRVINDGEGPLRYLVASTMNEPDVTVYPDSGTFGVYGGAPPGQQEGRTFEGYFPEDAAVDYWTTVAGEDGTDSEDERAEDED